MGCAPVFMKHRYLLLVLCTLGLVACNGPSMTPEATTPPEPESSLDIGTFTFGEIDLGGCGMTLYPPEGNPHEDGVYLFNGIASQDTGTEGTLRLKLDGAIVKFERLSGEGHEFYGQFNQQTFESLDGEFTAEVDAAVTSQGPDPEVSTVEGTITVTRGDQEAKVEAVGDAGC